MTGRGDVPCRDQEVGGAKMWSWFAPTGAPSRSFAFGYGGQTLDAGRAVHLPKRQRRRTRAPPQAGARGCLIIHGSLSPLSRIRAAGRLFQVRSSQRRQCVGSISTRFCVAALTQPPTVRRHGKTSACAAPCASITASSSSPSNGALITGCHICSTPADKVGRRVECHQNGRSQGAHLNGHRPDHKR